MKNDFAPLCQWIDDELYCELYCVQCPFSIGDGCPMFTSKDAALKALKTVRDRCNAIMICVTDRKSQ